MTREDMWEEFESQLISEVRTPITMSYNDSIRVAERGIKEVVKRWKKRLEQEPKTDVLDKIRDEIDAHRKPIKDMADTDDWFAGKLSGHDCDIEIIDKYRESEVKE